MRADVEVALGAVRPPAKPFPPRARDGRELCKRFMTQDRGCGNASCGRAHLALEDRPECPDFSRYGVCDRGDACWLRHRSMAASGFEHGVVMMVDAELAARHATRCAETLGAEAVTVVTRTALGRKNVDFLIGISLPDMDAGETLRRMFETEPHGMAKTKRTFAFPRKGAIRASFADENEDERGDAIERWLEIAMETMVSEVEDGARAYARVRAAPKWLEKNITRAMDSIFERRGEALRVSPPGGGVTSRDCTHFIDAVHMYGRTFVSIWKSRGACERATECASSSAGFIESDAPKLPKRGEATMYDLAVDHSIRLQDFRSEVQSSSCRAYFKLHEALLRAGLPIKEHWNCVDIGAAPGGWTRVLSERATTGMIWAIDPAELALEPMPGNAIHLQVLAHDAVETVREGLQATTSGELDLIVCDANMHPEACARIVLDFASKFAPKTRDSWLIMSTKNFCKGTANWLLSIDETVKTVRNAGYQDVFVHHLFSNCAEEKTLFARRAPVEEGISVP